MSRLIVKNLPKNVTENELRSVFGKLGRITDCSMRYTSDGKFRGFAFIGYENEEIALKAMQHFDQSFIRTLKIRVELCRNLFDVNAGKVSAPSGKGEKRKSTPADDQKTDTKKRKKVSQVDDIIQKEVESDQRLAEFLKLHESNPIWADDGALQVENKVAKSKPAKLEDDDVTTEPTNTETEESVRKLSAEQARIAEKIEESGRLFVRNLAYEAVSESDLENLFGRFGKLVEVELPRDLTTGRNKGFATITFLFAEQALEAFRSLDGSVFHGRLLHILAGEPRRDRVKDGDNNGERQQSLKDQRTTARREAEARAQSTGTRSWNTLFLGTNAVIERTSADLGVSKRELLLGGGSGAGLDSAAVRVALGETQIVQETREFLERNGVVLDSFEGARATERSRTVILVKNLSASVGEAELRNLLGRFGSLTRFVMPPKALTAIVEFSNETDARRAFRSLAYTKLHDMPLFLEFAPAGVFQAPPPATVEATNDTKVKPPKTAKTKKTKEAVVEGDAEKETEKDAAQSTTSGCTVLVRNLSFDTDEESLRQLCSKCGAVRSVSIAQKAHFDAKTVKSKRVQLLSLGYAFVDYATPRGAQRALRELQTTELHGHQLEFRLAERAGGQSNSNEQLESAPKQQESSGEEVKKKTETKEAEKDQRTKLVVRNVPFTANVGEIRALFSVFGELVRVTLPKRVAPARAGSADSPHRGFAFVQFVTHADAQRALDALRASTHLYGRRLVLDWAADAATPSLPE